jgi:RNA polymerase sigma-70 factor (ECF subfamily)
LTAALRDADAADELFQEFALQFVRGDFHRANPERGRFRDYVKTSLYRMVIQQFRRLRKRPGRLPTEFADHQADGAELAATLESADAEFAQSWRDELLARAWAALERAQQETGQPHYTILRFRADHGDLSSSEMAAQLSDKLGRSLSSAAVRQSLHRARDRFADLLLEEVAHSLESPTIEKIEEELIDLELLEYCRPALKRRESS